MFLPLCRRHGGVYLQQVKSQGPVAPLSGPVEGLPIGERSSGLETLDEDFDFFGVLEDEADLRPRKRHQRVLTEPPESLLMVGLPPSVIELALALGLGSLVGAEASQGSPLVSLVEPSTGVLTLLLTLLRGPCLVRPRNHLKRLSLGSLHHHFGPLLLHKLGLQLPIWSH
ncbi:hypothetical protein BHE74_00047243 [Ensete ventricosum]|nr:hypothetical protein BHE74_00047243 [Ensete ventricosum]RZR90423.1 hypothetical protein BHM03_00018284 [Ensete ventricosum]